MSYFVNSAPNESGNYGNPQSNRRAGMLELPESLLADYLDSMGFVRMTAVDGTVTDVTRNDEAYDAYISEHPPQPEPDPGDTASADEILNTLLGVEA